MTKGSTNPFDYLNAITHNKNDLLRNTGNDELAEQGYNAFVINKGLSYFPDTILYCNEMNTKSNCDNLLQFDYLINTIRPKKRFARWHKKVLTEDLEAVKTYYQINYSKAEQAIKCLSREQLDIIRKKLESCGENNVD